LIANTKKRQVQHTTFESVWQTPTNVTFQIKTADNPIKAYKEWVMSYDHGTEHCAVFDQWLEEMVKNGWEVKVTAG
jgi:hypothetical protein